MKLSILRVAAAALVLVLTSAACGGRSTPETRPSTPAPTGSLTSPAPGQSRPSSPGPTVTSTPPKTPPPTTSTGSPSPTPPQVVVTLDRACVRRGVASDVQGITVRTKPGYPAGFQTEYSDGSSIVGHPEYQSGGQATGFADANGVWRHTWVVPEAAPTGKAIVHVNVGTPEPPLLPFTVVGKNQQCP